MYPLRVFFVCQKGVNQSIQLCVLHAEETTTATKLNYYFWAPEFYHLYYFSHFPKHLNPTNTLNSELATKKIFVRLSTTT